jgi:hypothetical protein
LKVFDWLRLFGKTSFFILLMTETLWEIRYFMVLIFLTLAMFGIPMAVLNQNREEDQNVISKTFDLWIIDMIINQYLLALGEFTSLGEFDKGPQAYMCYIFFALATFVSQVTMFNMLIAIMGDTFEKITENKEVNSIKSKLNLLSELNATMRLRDRA